MRAVFIGSGGCGDILYTLSAATLWQNEYEHGIADIYVNSHQEIVDFVNKCTYFKAYKCPERLNQTVNPEDPLNLPKEFLDDLVYKYDNVYSCFSDGLFNQSFAFPWRYYVRNYVDFLQTKINIKTNLPPPGLFRKDIKYTFIHASSITMEKNYPLQKLQVLVNLFNKVGYKVIIARISSWKGTELPFFCQGDYIDLVDKPIDEVVNVMNACDYFVGIDSGPSHIACHLGMPRIVLQQHYNVPFHLARYHEAPNLDMPLESSPEAIFNRVMLNIREPLTLAIPASIQIPYNVDLNQLLIKKY